MLYILSPLKVGTISNTYSATVQWRSESATTLQRIQLEQVIHIAFTLRTFGCCYNDATHFVYGL